MGITSNKNLSIKKKEIPGIKSTKNILLENKDIKSVKSNESINYTNLRKAMKSSYIIKQLFSYLSENKKLSIIIYNKNYQNLFEINIEDYKKNCIAFIEGDRNGKCKEFYKNNELRFEGEYLNGKRSGKGKEYKHNRLEFEGEYLNGKRWKGKKYRFDRLEFEGEYLNRKKWNGIA